MKVCPVVAELFHADGRTDATKLIVALRNFVDASKNHTLSLSIFLVLRSIILNLLSIENYLFIEIILFAAPCSLLPGSAAPLASHRPLLRKYVISWVGLLADLEVLDNRRFS